jgi:hypothetical protein
MAATKTLTASWGVSDKNTEYGIVTDLTTSEEPLHQPLQNEEGAIIDTTKYDTHYTLSMTIQVKSDVKPPETGTEIKMDDRTYYITRVERLYSNRDYQKLRIDGEAYTDWPTTTSSGGSTPSNPSVSP